jgi:hypothetical protein
VWWMLDDSSIVLWTKLFIIVDKLQLLNELQKKQVKYPELQNLDELVDSLVFVYGINTFILFVGWLIFDM